MTGILGLADMLLRSPLRDQEREWVETLKSSATGLLTLLDDVLDLTKLEVGRLRLVEEQFDPEELVRNQVALVRPKVAGRGLALDLVVEPSVPDIVRGDPARVRQVLLKLLVNALKYTDEGKIDVRLGSEEAESSDAEDTVRLRIDVRDTGRGIAPEQHEEIFGLFYQGDPAAGRRHPGSGLGLAISRRLARALGGDITVQSQVGSGSLFSFVVAVTPVSSKDDPEMPLRDFSGLRILLVEDNPVNQLVTVAMLRALGATVDAAEDGETALKATAEASWDVVFMDCQMPGMDGYEATRAIRARELASGDSTRLPIIALTASALASERKKCFDVGMDGFLAKPSQKKDLLAAVHAVLSKASGPE